VGAGSALLSPSPDNRWQTLAQLVPGITNTRNDSEVPTLAVYAPPSSAEQPPSGGSIYPPAPAAAIYAPPSSAEQPHSVESVYLPQAGALGAAAAADGLPLDADGRQTSSDQSRQQQLQHHHPHPPHRLDYYAPQVPLLFVGVQIPWGNA
jgi:hypothetical protein